MTAKDAKYAKGGRREKRIEEEDSNDSIMGLRQRRQPSYARRCSTIDRIMVRIAAMKSHGLTDLRRVLAEHQAGVNASYREEKQARWHLTRQFVRF